MLYNNLAALVTKQSSPRKNTRIRGYTNRGHHLPKQNQALPCRNGSSQCLTGTHHQHTSTTITTPTTNTEAGIIGYATGRSMRPQLRRKRDHHVSIKLFIICLSIYVSFDSSRDSLLYSSFEILPIRFNSLFRLMAI